VSVPAYPGTPTPATVRAATWLLFGIGGIILVKAAVDLIVINTPLSVYRDAYTGETGSGFESIAGATFDILFAAAVAILAILNNHGRNGARVTTLVVGGIFLLCGGSNSLNDLAAAGKPADPLDGQGRLAAVLPAGYGILFALLDLLILVAVAGAVILLALPPSNRYFRRLPVGGYPAAYPVPHHPVPSQAFGGSPAFAAQPPPSGPAFARQPAPNGPAFAGQPPPSGPAFAGQPLPGGPAFAGQPLPGGPVFGPGSSSEPPHTSSLPPIDPWAAPAEGDEPTHRENPPANA